MCGEKPGGRTVRYYRVTEVPDVVGGLMMKPTNHGPAFKFESRMQQTSQCADDVQGEKVWYVWEGGFEEFRHRMSADIHAAVSVSERRLVFSNACGGAGRFWAAFRGNSVGRSSETGKTDI